MNNEDTQRLSSQDKCGENSSGSLLEGASAYAQGVLNDIKALAGTTFCKGVQIVRLKEWAKRNNCWFDNRDSFGEFFDRGSENEAYLAPNGTEIIKLNDFRYSDDNLTPFFERIRIHNHYFPDCAYQLIGFGNNRDGKTCAVLCQPFIIAERLAEQYEIDAELERLGFQKEQEDYFTNGEYDIFDAVPNNVLMGTDRHLYFIDTIIFKSGTGGYNTYHCYSPRVKERN